MDKRNGNFVCSYVSSHIESGACQSTRYYIQLRRLCWKPDTDMYYRSVLDMHGSKERNEKKRKGKKENKQECKKAFAQINLHSRQFSPWNNIFLHCADYTDSKGRYLRKSTILKHIYMYWDDKESERGHRQGSVNYLSCVALFDI